MEPLITGIVLRKIPLDPSRKGINTTWKATVRSAEGDSAAIVKHIPDHEIMVECLCAMLGRSLQLPIPRPMLLKDAKLGALFGCEELPHPDLKHSHLPSAVLATYLTAWEKLADSAAFDEWIANPDRHGGNLLTDGSGEFWLIDHGLTLHPVLNPADKSNNYLLNIAGEFANDDIKRRRLINAFKQFFEQLPEALSTEANLQAHPFFSESVLQFLDERKPVLFSLLRATVLNHDEIPGF